MVVSFVRSLEARLKGPYDICAVLIKTQGCEHCHHLNGFAADIREALRQPRGLPAVSVLNLIHKASCGASLIARDARAHCSDVFSAAMLLALSGPRQ